MPQTSEVGLEDEDQISYLDIQMYFLTNGSTLSVFVVGPWLNIELALLLTAQHRVHKE